MAVRKKANCLGRGVVAVIVKGNRIISTGYNGTPEAMSNCLAEVVNDCKTPVDRICCRAAAAGRTGGLIHAASGIGGGSGGLRTNR